MRKLCLSLALALLSACGKSDNEPGPGGVTLGEARALDEAAEMIEQRRLPAEALRPPPPGATTSPAR
jgi:hypothetical protein